MALKKNSFFAKSLPKNKYLGIVVIILISLVLAVTLYFLGQRQQYQSDASDSEKIIAFRGAVSKYNSYDLGANRFTKLKCPNKSFITDTTMDVTMKLPLETNYATYKAQWNCIEPNFNFEPISKTALAQLVLKAPRGYVCQSAYIYKDTTGDSYFPPFDKETCTLTLDLTKYTFTNFFVWFKVLPK